MNWGKSFLILVLAFIILLMSTPPVYGGLLGATHSLLEWFVFVCIPSIAAAFLFQQWKKEPFTIAELCAVVAANILLLIPAIVLTSIYILPLHFVVYPLLALSFLSCFVIYKSKLRAIKFTTQDIGLVIAVLLMGALIWVITHAYYPLPDFDPYYWLTKYQSALAAYKAGNLSVGGRSGFFALFFLYRLIAHIDAYAIFKYVLPSLYILPVFPIWMLAKKMKHPVITAAILSTLVWSASTILYALTSMPQMICISAFFFFIAFLTYARITRDPFFIAISIGVLVLCLPLYELAIVPCIAITCCLIWGKRNSIAAYIKSNPIVMILGALLVATNLHYISGQIIFFIFWFLRIFSQILSIKINLLFPAYYVNIDGNSVGWPGIVGVIQYYAYYVGPPIIIIFSYILFLISQKKWRNSIVRELKSSIETQTVFLTFLIFFCMSEIFPRVLSLALLPERIWIFGGIALMYPATLVLLHLSQKTSRYIAVALLAGSVASILGASYVNYQKVHLIPDYQLASASWVQKNLDKNRIMISDENSNLLSFFSSSNTAALSPLYCNKDFADPKALISKLAAAGITEKNTQHAYIFYAQTDPNNPYKVRPYAKHRESCTPFVFDAHPESYQRVYSNDERVIIWEIK